LSGTESTTADEVASRIVAPEDRLRAQFYRLIAFFLSEPLSDDDVRTAAELAGNETVLGRAVREFAGIASRSDPATLREAYQDLFIGVGRGVFVPYGSYYLTGFLHEKPLAKLRQDMERLGLARNAGVAEPEDHISSVLEAMAGLIDGTYGAPLPLEEQKRFFDAHVGSWAPYFFRDLEACDTSPFYAAIGHIGRVFMEIEHKALEID
jgi:TorA maturation chaperone TorD